MPDKKPRARYYEPASKGIVDDVKKLVKATVDYATPSAMKGKTRQAQYDRSVDSDVTGRRSNQSTDSANGY